MSPFSRTLLIATVATAGLANAPAMAETLKFTANLVAASETPPTMSSSTGTADATLDTVSKVLSWTVNYVDLTGKATAAHFHGPAAVGAKAPPVVGLMGDLTSPIKGTATLTDKQIADLETGMWYFNVHSAKYPDGEIRGQVVAAK